MHKYPNIKLLFTYYPKSAKHVIFDNTKSNFGNKSKSIMSFNIDINTIKEFDNFNDAYSTLELGRDVNKFNL